MKRKRKVFKAIEFESDANGAIRAVREKNGSRLNNKQVDVSLGNVISWFFLLLATVCL